MTRFLCAAALSCVCLSTVSAATVQPINIEQFCVTPGQHATLTWRIESGSLGETTEVVIRDYADRVVQSPSANVTGEGLLELPVQLGPGFYEIEFSATKQRFGVISHPAYGGKRDPFFAIDSAMSWLVHDDATREGLVKVLARSGIPMSRERLNWAEINSEKGDWNWDGQRRYETLRQMCRREGVEVLEMFHGTTDWAGRVGKYPEDLVGTAQAWKQIVERYGSTWGAMEVWNEPDISFGDYLPADQYAALVKTFAYVFQEQEATAPLVGGVFAHYNQEYLDNAGDNGLPHWASVISFHTYGRAMEMEKLIKRYRQWLVDCDRPHVPLWLTECGRPWKRGPERPPADQDAESALDIIMKGVESKACGVARYFPFVYPYYEERESNFGMMGKEATPLRSMAAYVQLVTTLSHKQYLGDLTCADANLLRARVFGDEQETIAILYAGNQSRDARVRLGLPVAAIAGIDGRPITLAADGSVPVPDGLVYVRLNRERLGERLRTETEAMQLNAHVSKRPPEPRHVSPIVVRYQFDSEDVAPKTEGYRLVAEKPGKAPFVFRVFNLSSKDLKRSIRLTFLHPESFEWEDVQEATIPAQGHVDVHWTVDLAKAFAATGTLTARVSTVEEGSEADEFVEIDLSGNPTLKQVLQRYSTQWPLPIDDLPAWRASISATGKMTLEADEDDGWRLKCQFQGGDRWVYPYFRLAEDVAVEQYSAIVLRARCSKKAAVRVFFWEGNTGVGYLSSVVIPSDGNWHTAVVQFDDLMVSGANQPDPNHQLDLAQVRRISIGMNSESDDNTLEVSEVFFVAQ